MDAPTAQSSIPRSPAATRPVRVRCPAHARRPATAGALGGVRAGDSMLELPRLQAGSIDAIITDPPYGISWTDEAGRGVLNDDGPYVWWMRSAHDALRRGGPIVCFCRWDVSEAFRLALSWAGFTVRSMIVWSKGGGGKGDTRRTLCPTHELAWLATKGNWRLPGKRIGDVLTAPRVRVGRTHPTEKPVAMLREIVRAVTRPGDLVLDPFCGTGSTGAACLAEGRRFMGIDLDPAHVATARRRLRAISRAHVQVKAPARLHAPIDAASTDRRSTVETRSKAHRAPVDDRSNRGRGARGVPKPRARRAPCPSEKPRSCDPTRARRSRFVSQTSDARDRSRFASRGRPGS